MTEKSVLRPGEACDDPYAAFLAEQRKRDAEWFSNQATKKSKAGNAASPEPKEPAEDVGALKKELDAKNAECAALKCQVQELQRVSISAVEAHNKTQENFFKVNIMLMCGTDSSQCQNLYNLSDFKRTLF